jgi:hypothetical protein
VARATLWPELCSNSEMSCGKKPLNIPVVSTLISAACSSAGKDREYDEDRSHVFPKKDLGKAPKCSHWILLWRAA